MQKLKIRIVNTSSLPLPQYSTPLSAGMDLRADIEVPLTIAPMGRVLVPTGIRIELPEGYEAQIRPRSGLAAKHGVTVLNTPGTIDADYRGEIKVILVNLSDTPFTFERGERIAQMVISSYTRAEWVETDELGESARGEGGFGHTGVK